MKINVIEGSEFQEPEITICCKSVQNPLISRIITEVNSIDNKILGRKDGELCVLETKDILYFDTAERHTFIYTNSDIYETTLSLYQLEDRLENRGFFRANKATIVNFQHIRSMRPEIGGRFMLTMDNGERILMSRQYSEILKNRLESIL